MKSSFLTKCLFMSILSFLSLQLNAQDWANLKRYQSENEALTAPAKNESRVVFMGNSITQGWKEKHPEFFTENPFICRGISGQTTPQMLIRLRQDVIALKPKVVVILAGTNDIAGNTGPLFSAQIFFQFIIRIKSAVCKILFVILGVANIFYYVFTPIKEQIG